MFIYLKKKKLWDKNNTGEDYHQDSSKLQQEDSLEILPFLKKKWFANRSPISHVTEIVKRFQGG